jgi:hypothetical protein
MARRIVPIHGQFFTRWVCAECGWEFNPSGPPVGTSLEAMIKSFQAQRDREFAAHICAENPRAPGQQGKQPQDDESMCRFGQFSSPASVSVLLA